MFELAGEEAGGSLYGQCPGEGCEIWDAAAGTYEEKIESLVCAGCRDCGGNPPKPPEEPDDEPVDEIECEELVRDIEDIVAWQRSGIETDWDLYDYEIKRLVLVWHSSEQQVAAIQKGRLADFIKSWFKDK